jgi:DNA-binding response OmpR family regulator
MSDSTPPFTPAPGSPAPAGAAKRILVIDDDEMVRTFVRRALESSGYVVSVATNGYEAMISFRQSKPDGVITDLLMPERDGIETILEIRRHAPEVPIVAISGGFNAMSSIYLKTAEQLGADAVLSKPFSIEQLVTTVESLMKPKPGQAPQ